MKKCLLLAAVCLLTLLPVRGFAAENSHSTGIFNPSIPIGGILIWSSKVKIPKDYLICDGRQLDSGQYNQLYNVIGYTFTPDNLKGGTYFNLPDMRGRFARGWDNSGTIDPNRKFGSKQDDTFKSHVHLGGYKLFNCENLVNATKELPRQKGFDFASEMRQVSPWQANSEATGGTETRPKNVALIYLIRYKTCPL